MLVFLFRMTSTFWDTKSVKNATNESLLSYCMGKTLLLITAQTDSSLQKCDDIDW